MSENNPVPDKKPPRAIGQRPVGTSSTNSDGGYNAGMAVFSYIIGGIIVWSLIGWGLDVLFGSRWLVLAGALLGAAGGFYLAFAHRLFHRIEHDGDPEGPGRNADQEPNQ